MIDLPTDPGHDPRPLTPAGAVRLVVAAATVVAVQASVVDPISAPVLHHLDLPLALASVLVLARPTHSVVIGLIFGLMVDASGQRLFGLNTIAYATLGPVAHSLPVPALRHHGLVVWWRAGVTGLAVATVVAVGSAIASGGPTPGVVASVLVTGLLVGLVAVPLGRVVDRSFGRRRTMGSLASPRIGGGTRPGPIRTVGP